MNVTGLTLIFNSDDPKGMFKFYTDVVGLPANPDMGEEAVSAGPVGITFDSHNEAPGIAKEPGRQIVSLFVEDVAAEEKRIEAQGVKFIRKQGKEFWGGVISTFVDPAGNYVQLIEFRA